MLPSHISWSSIELLHNVIRTLDFFQERSKNPHLFPDSPETTQPVRLPRYPIAYKAKVKQHGSNCAVQVTREGIFAQSRTQMLVSGVDYKGFAQWVARSESYWRGFQPDITIFGEWCGPGVEAGMAISGYDRKVFAIFGLQLGRDLDARIIYDPDEIIARLPKEKHPDVFVLPWWEEANVALHFGDTTSLEKSAARLNQLVEAVEREDPWVKATFGLSGLGEGLVFYPIGEDIPTDPENLARLMFKAKGEKHRTANTKAPVQIAAEVVAGVKEFVSLMVTEARLQQGLSTTCAGKAEMKQMRAFLDWLSSDVKKESVAELEASGLTWEKVQKEVQTAARDWFKSKAL